MHEEQIKEQYIEQRDEQYAFTWPGKRAAQGAAQAPAAGRLVPAAAGECDSPHLFIEGENLTVLKLLAAEYSERVKMIYIDPPYNTGKTFVYHDRRGRNAWLNMIYSRLLAARPLLRPDGVIVVSIDDNQAHTLRMVMDEIFGAENFVTQFVWHSSTAGGIRARHVNQNHEYALCYARDVAQLPRLHAPLSPEAIRQYTKEDARGRYREKDFAWITRSTNENQRYLILCPDGSHVQPRVGYLFRYVRERFAQALRDDLVVFKKTDTSPLINEQGAQAKWNIYIKKYLGDGMGAPASLIPKSLIGLSNRGTAEIKELFGARVFENAKSTSYLRYLLRVGLGGQEERMTRGQEDEKARGGGEERIVLDFFAGSCSTAHAVLAMNRDDRAAGCAGNRRFIMVQQAEPTPARSVARRTGFETIAELGLARIRRVMAQGEHEPDALRVLRLVDDEANDKLSDKLSDKSRGKPKSHNG